MNYIRLTTVHRNLLDCLEEVQQLNGTLWADDGKNSADKRAQATRLLRLSDSLALASAQVREAYWEGRA